MTTPDDRIGAKLTRVFGALGDWLERVRDHEMFRRSEAARRRREIESRVVAAVAGFLCLAILAGFCWLSRTRGGS